MGKRRLAPVNLDARDAEQTLPVNVAEVEKLLDVLLYQGRRAQTEAQGTAMSFGRRTRGNGGNSTREIARSMGFVAGGEICKTYAKHIRRHRDSRKHLSYSSNKMIPRLLLESTLCIMPRL